MGTKKNKPVDRLKLILWRSALVLENLSRLLCYIALSAFAGRIDAGKKPHQLGRTLIKNSLGAAMQKALAPGPAFITFSN